MLLNKKYLLVSVVSLFFMGGTQAMQSDKKFSKLSEACGEYSEQSCMWKSDENPECAKIKQVMKECELSEAEYAKHANAFNKEADSYLTNCRHGNNLNASCTKSLQAIRGYLNYARVYMSPNTLSKRVQIEDALYQDKIALREDIGDIGAFEKQVLTQCFGFREDRYAQTELNYHSGDVCNKWVKDAVVQFGSKDPSIAHKYAYIEKREKEDVRRARLVSLINNLSLNKSEPLYQQTVHTLTKDFDLFKEVLQEVKTMPWMEYRVVGYSKMKGNLVYPGLLKPFIQEENLTAKDSAIQNGLTTIVNDWRMRGNIPQEPTYEEQEAAGEKIGDGLSVAWALLRHDTVKQADKVGLALLSDEQKATIVDEIKIRCGDRPNNTLDAKMYGKNNCTQFVHRYQTILNDAKVNLYCENC